MLVNDSILSGKWFVVVSRKSDKNVPIIVSFRLKNNNSKIVSVGSFRFASFRLLFRARYKRNETTAPFLFLFSFLVLFSLFVFFSLFGGVRIRTTGRRWSCRA